MAQPAADTPAPGPREILSLLAPFPGRAAIAVRVALICALTLLVTSMYGTPEAAISAYVVFFVNKPDRVSSILTAMAMLVLITSLIALVLVIAMFSVDYSVLRVSWIVVLSMGLLYLTSASKLRPVGAIIAMIVGFGLDQLGNTPFGEAATRGLLYAWLMVAIPIGVSVAINLLIAPSPRTLAGEQLAARLRLAALRLRGDEATRAAFDASLRGGDSQLMKWIKLSKLEGTSAAADVVALRQAAASSTAILVAIDLADREPDARLPARFTAPLAATLDDMATLLQQGGYPVDIALTLPATDALPPLAQSLARGEAGSLALSFVSTADYGLLPSLLREFGARYPQVRLRLVEATSDVQIEELAAGRVDAGLIIPPVPPRHAAELSYLPVVREPLVLAMPAAVSDAPEETPVRLADVAALPLVIFPRRLAPGFYDIITGCYGAAGVAPRIGQEAIQMQTIVSLVSAGMGVALVPQSLRNLRRTGVVYRPLGDGAPVVETGLVWRTGDVSPVLAGFIDIVRAQAGSRA